MIFRARWWMAVALVASIAPIGCELIASVDRSEIPGFGGSADGGAATGGDGGATGTAGSPATGGTAGEGGSPECTAARQCPDPAEECVEAACTDGTCTTANVGEGEPTSRGQIDEDCKQQVCDGQGSTELIDDADDPKADGLACTQDLCAQGQPVNVNEQAGTACSEGGGKLCDGDGVCVECLMDVDCTVAGEVCSSAHECVPVTCSDDVQNGNESDVDCGGACGATCAVGDSCFDAGDCISSVCTSQACAAPSCFDGAENGDETDVDCGGTCLADCQADQGCAVDADCKGGSCSGTVCLPSCTDGVENNGETDTDCGGPNCADCADGKECGSDDDCISGGCCGVPTTCNACCNGVEDGDETGVDCGGPTCTDCPDFETCLVDQDCASNVCAQGICYPAACGNGVKDGSESDVDCGGDVCPECAGGLSCVDGDDCNSGFCADGVCCDVACTGLCVACTAAKKGSGANGVCGSIASDTDPDNECALDPASTCQKDGACDGSGACGLHPVGTVCAPQTCISTQQQNADTCNGTGTCVDGGTTSCGLYVCGANACNTSCMDIFGCATGSYCAANACVPQKPAGQSCSSALECQTAVCVASLCRPQHCNNGVDDGLTESDVDCGLECGPNCASGDSCESNGDCASPLTCGPVVPNVCG
jgi:hypothetical protein